MTSVISLFEKARDRESRRGLKFGTEVDHPVPMPSAPLTKALGRSRRAETKVLYCCPLGLSWSGHVDAHGRSGSFSKELGNNKPLVWFVCCSDGLDGLQEYLILSSYLVTYLTCFCNNTSWHKQLEIHRVACQGAMEAWLPEVTSLAPILFLRERCIPTTMTPACKTEKSLT